MADTLLNSIKIKSKIKDYEVVFFEDILEKFHHELRDDDVVIIDKSVQNIYGQLLFKNFDANRLITIQASEFQKSYQEIEQIIDKLINLGFKKNNRLISIGGGITQDCVAFISSILYRGVDWIFVPTTLLAQGDSCIGSKTSVNFGKYKNLIGGFYPPSKILVSPIFLKSLQNKEIKSGLGEMLHYFIVSSKEDFNFFKDNYEKSLVDQKTLQKIISKSLQIKKKYIEIDEFDKNERQVFNYGHSFGHAIESLQNYEIPHGIAVSFGMDISNYVSSKMGLIDDSIRIEIREILQKIWSGYCIKNIEIGAFMNALSKDKKNVGDKLGLILNEGYGSIKKHLIHPDDKFVDHIKNYFKDELI